jgi:hypothetical protein
MENKLSILDKKIWIIKIFYLPLQCQIKRIDMITEDYVSFETAKLLKEKGFNEKTPQNYFVGDDKPRGCKIGEMIYHKKLTEDTHLIAAPTLQMTMKWLREVHNKSIEVRSQGLKATSIGWVVEIYNLRNQDEEFHHPYTFPTYEEACEAGIKYCLENLI